jgi:hypothetical protein
MTFLSRTIIWARMAASCSAPSEVAANDELLVLGDSVLHPQVVRDLLVAALRDCAASAWAGPLADDVVIAAPAQVAVVLRRGEPASAAQIARDGDQSRMLSFSCWICVESLAFPGQRHTRRRDLVPSDGHADHDLGQVVAVVLGLAQVRNPAYRPSSGPSAPPATRAPC